MNSTNETLLFDRFSIMYNLCVFHLYYRHVCISLYTCANVICIELLLTYLLTYITGIGNVNFFCSCDLDLDPMTFIYEPDPYSLEIHRMCNCKYELPTARLSKVIVRQTDRQTDRHDRNYTPGRFAGDRKLQFIQI